MGKTFVEDERPCDSCVNVTRYGCVSWNCEYINRDEAIKAWREKHETADRKTEPQAETEMERLECIDNEIEDAWARIRELTDEPQVEETEMDEYYKDHDEFYDCDRYVVTNDEGERAYNCIGCEQTDCSWK